MATYEERRDKRFHENTVAALKDIEGRAMPLPQDERYAAAYGILRGYVESLLRLYPYSVCLCVAYPGSSAGSLMTDVVYWREQNRFLRQDLFLIPYEPMIIITELSDLIIEQVTVTSDVVITARATSPTSSCPCCGTLSKRVHSHYQRTLRDLPASGRLVHLLMQVRRFFCEEKTCVRKIFAERFPSLTQPRAKFTLRLQEALREMGFEQGGEAGARLGRKLSYPGSPDTILRLVKQAKPPTTSSPRVVGIDDWCWKRGLLYPRDAQRDVHSAEITREHASWLSSFM